MLVSIAMSFSMLTLEVGARLRCDTFPHVICIPSTLKTTQLWAAAVKKAAMKSSLWLRVLLAKSHAASFVPSQLVETLIVICHWRRDAVGVHRICALQILLAAFDVMPHEQMR